VASPQDPSEPSVVVEEPTDIDPRGAGSFRDEKTAAAETRTVKLGVTAPWLATADPEPRPTRPRDPLFWPAVVFITILTVAIAAMLLTQGGGHGGAGRGSGIFSTH
jgi:hypothetical protein